MLSTYALSVVSDFAVIGSLFSSLILSLEFFLIATCLKNYRKEFALFGTLLIAISLCDLFHKYLLPLQYEVIRALLWSWYGPLVASLFGVKLIKVVLSGVIISLSSIACFFFSPIYVTTIALVASFLLSAGVHCKKWYRSSSCPSAILFVFSLAQAVACMNYVPVLLTNNAQLVVLGYAQYAFISLCALLGGWIYIPHELRHREIGSFTSLKLMLLSVLVVGTQCVIYALTFRWLEYDATIFTLGCMIQGGALIWVYLLHRMEFVVYTDEVASLIKLRTSSLEERHGELALLNSNLVLAVKNQREIVKVQADKIEQQKRLEIAGKTASLVAHDIHNLATPIQSNLTYLEDLLARAGIKDKTVDTLRKQIQSIIEFNEQLLALGRRETPKYEEIELNTLLENIKISVGVLGKDILIDESAQKAITVGSWVQLKRAFLNIIMNALQAIQQQNNSRVTITLERVANTQVRQCSIGSLLVSDYWIVRVIDNGAGISAVAKEKIFEPYYTTKESIEGNGLGLAITAAIISDHHGAVEVIDRVDGTEFCVYLPVCKELSVETRTQDACKNVTALVINCDACGSIEVASSCGLADADLWCVSDIKEAVDVILIVPFDVVVVASYPWCTPTLGEFGGFVRSINHDTRLLYIGKDRVAVSSARPFEFVNTGDVVSEIALYARYPAQASSSHHKDY